ILLTQGRAEFSTILFLNSCHRRGTESAQSSTENSFSRETLASPSEYFQRLQKQFHVQEIRQQRVRLMCPQLILRANAAGRQGQLLCAEMAGTGYVVWSITNHDELCGREIRSEMLVDSLRGLRRQVAAIE